MSAETEKQFERTVPLRSVLGNEFLALQKERNHQRKRFEECMDKMAYDTIPYRRSVITLSRFIDEMLPQIIKYTDDMKQSGEGLNRAEMDARNPLWQGPLIMDRRSERIIWTRFAIERYYAALPKTTRSQLRKYHPSLWTDLRSAWKKFRSDIHLWQNARMPYDGSQAMRSMIHFQITARLAASVND